MEVIYYTIVAAGLYFISDWLLDRIEVSRGERFQNRGTRTLVFFVIILTLGFITFGFINLFVLPTDGTK